MERDTYHTGCYNDNATFQSVCGFWSPEFGTDGRLNEELFGLYNTTYNGASDYAMELHPRPAVAGLQAVWNLSASASAASGNATARRRLLGGAGDAPAVYTAVFPVSLGTLLKQTWVLVLLPLVPIVTMLPLVVLPWLWFTCRRREPEAEQLFDFYSPRGHLSVSFHRPPDALSLSGVSQDRGDSLPHFGEVSFFVDTLAHFFWLLLSDATDRDHVMQDFVLVILDKWVCGGGGGHCRGVHRGGHSNAPVPLDPPPQTGPLEQGLSLRNDILEGQQEVLGGDTRRSELNRRRFAVDRRRVAGPRQLVTPPPPRRSTLAQAYLSPPVLPFWGGVLGTPPPPSGPVCCSWGAVVLHRGSVSTPSLSSPL